MEERIKMMEKQVKALADLCLSQNDTINSIIVCMDTTNVLLNRSAEIDRDLFEYCKNLRKEVEKLKGERLS